MNNYGMFLINKLSAKLSDFLNITNKIIPVYDNCKPIISKLVDIKNKYANFKPEPFNNKKIKKENHNNNSLPQFFI